MENLTLNTLVEKRTKSGIERFRLSERYNEEVFGSEEDYLSLVNNWVQAGRAFIIDERTEDQKMADSIANELMSVQKSKTIQQDHEDRVHYNERAHGVYEKVAFPAKTLLEAQEMHQVLMRNFNIQSHQLGIAMEGGTIDVTITNCPAGTFNSIQRAFGVRRATETVTNTVNKTAKGIVNGTDLAVNSLVTPVAKTAIGTGAKIAKTLFSFGAKIGGIAVSEITKASKECVNEIKTDGYIAEAKGEVIEGYHSVKRAIGNTQFGSGMGGGRVIS